jgi:hypothetical protein
MLWLLAVNNNMIDGGIPSDLMNLYKLFHLDLSSNRFEGPIPMEIFAMPSVERIFLAENPALEEGPIPSTLEGMTQLHELSLKNTNRIGPLPELVEFGKLELLDLDNNAFTGNIPASYGELSSLKYLLLNRNNIDGRLPVFEKTIDLQAILLDGTNVMGDFSSICALPNFSGKTDHHIAIADCANPDNGIICECCRCCSKADSTESSCSDPMVANLDWTWEDQFRRGEDNVLLSMGLLD